MKISDKELYSLVNKVFENEKTIQRAELHNSATDDKIQSTNEKLKELKDEIWELKNYGKRLNKNEQDISILNERSISQEKVLNSVKNELEAKMVTRQQLDEIKYKKWRIGLAIVGLVIAFIAGMNFDKMKRFISEYEQEKTEKQNVASDKNVSNKNNTQKMENIDVPSDNKK